MLLLLLPLRAFGHGRTGKFVDRAVAAGTLENPIAAGVDHSRHLAVAWHIFPTVPGVPLRIDLGGDGHAAKPTCPPSDWTRAGWQSSPAYLARRRRHRHRPGLRLRTRGARAYLG